MKIAARMPMMAITVSSSIRVNAERGRRFGRRMVEEGELEGGRGSEATVSLKNPEHKQIFPGGTCHSERSEGSTRSKPSAAGARRGESQPVASPATSLRSG